MTTSNSDINDSCAICLTSPPTLPIKTPCNHIFCYLCLKGIYIVNHELKCPLCRAEIGISVITNFSTKMINTDIVPTISPIQRWCYESLGGGWWLFDDVSCAELENRYQLFIANKEFDNILTVGAVNIKIVFDDAEMYQENTSNGKRRRIKRTIEPNDIIKGISGAKLTNN